MDEHLHEDRTTPCVQGAEPCGVYLEQLATQQIDKICLARKSGQGDETPPESANVASTQIDLSDSEGWCPVSGLLNPGSFDLAVENEVLDAHGFVVPPEHGAAYGAYSSAAAPMLQLWQEKWGSWLQETSASAFCAPNAHVLGMTRGGIPNPYRAQVWLVASGAKMMQAANPTLYTDLIEAIQRDNGQGLTIAREVVDQIAKDLPRSLPHHILFRGNNQDTQAAMRRVLTAYALHNMTVGYCQGMNVLCGLLLLLMPEEEAFFLLKTIVERVLPAYFGQGLTGLTNDQSVIEAMIQDRAPELIEHLSEIGLPMHVVTTRWLLCIFITAMPSEGALRIWDCVIMEGRKALFRAIMAFFELLKPKLLQCPDCDTAFELLRTVIQKIH